VGRGTIDLDKTLAELEIDDEPLLADGEKRARVVDLLQSRSGVFRAAAYETPTMKERRPARGSMEPGAFWYYNNWDFNALCTIFERETRAGIFEAFKREIAAPLQMEDFRLMDTYYHLERQHSIHPAYPFRMSARDMARFGLLFLRDGRWKDLEIVPERWVEASRRAYSEVPHWDGYGYGYMWWVNIDETDRKLGMYAALGYGGHMIAVLPGENLVLVNRSNTYLGRETARTELLGLVDVILDAKGPAPAANPRLVPLGGAPTGTEAEPDFSLPPDLYAGTYAFDSEETSVGTIPYVVGDMIGQSVRIEADGRRLLMIDNLGQQFVLTPRSPTECLVQDMDVPLLFEAGDGARPARVTLDARPAWRVSGARVRTPPHEDR